MLRKVLMVAVATVMCCNEELQSMVSSSRDYSLVDNAKSCLSLWRLVDKLSTPAEKAIYDTLWDKNKSLKDNKQLLLDAFVDTCCDFSFSAYKTQISGMYIGRLDKGQEIIFVDKGFTANMLPNSDEVLLYSNKDRVHGLLVNMNTQVFPYTKPLTLTPWMKSNFIKYLKKIGEDSVGSEILRVYVSKYKAHQWMPKLTFIPVCNLGVGLSYSTGSSIWKYMHREDSFITKYQRVTRPYKFIVFSPNWFDSLHWGLRAYLNPDVDQEITVDIGTVSREVSLVHHIIYALNITRTQDRRGTQVIDARGGDSNFYSDIKSIGKCIVSGKQLNNHVFVDDYIYSTLFGLTTQGLNLMNEAMYTAHRYEYLRLAYVSKDTQVSIDGNDISNKESFRFLIDYFQKKGDLNLYKYYLSPKSPLEYPEFGKGDYKYTDEYSAKPTKE